LHEAIKVALTLPGEIDETEELYKDVLVRSKRVKNLLSLVSNTSFDFSQLSKLQQNNTDLAFSLDKKLKQLSDIKDQLEVDVNEKIKPVLDGLYRFEDTTVRVEIPRVKQNLAQVLVEVEVLEPRAKEAYGNVRELLDLLARAEKLISDLERLLKIIDQKVSSYTTEVGRLEQEIADLRKRIKQLLENIQEAQTEVKVLQQSIVDLGTLLMELFKNLIKTSRAIRFAQNKVAKSQGDEEILRKRLLALDTQIATDNKTILGVEQNLANLDERLITTTSLSRPVHQAAHKLWKKSQRSVVLVRQVGRDSRTLNAQIENETLALDSKLKKLKKTAEKVESKRKEVEALLPNIDDIKNSDFVTEILEIRTRLDQIQTEFNIKSLDAVAASDALAEPVVGETKPDSTFAPSTSLELVTEPTIADPAVVGVDSESVNHPTPNLEPEASLESAPQPAYELSLESRIINQIELELKYFKQHVEQEFKKFRVWQQRTLVVVLMGLTGIIIVGYLGTKYPLPVIPPLAETPIVVATLSFTPTIQLTSTIIATETHTPTATLTSTGTNTATPSPTEVSVTATSTSPSNNQSISLLPLITSPLLTERFARDMAGEPINANNDAGIQIIGTNEEKTWLLVKTEQGLGWTMYSSEIQWQGSEDSLPVVFTCVFNTSLNGQDENLRREANDSSEYVTISGNPVTAYFRGTFVIQGTDSTQDWIKAVIGDTVGWLKKSAMDFCSSTSLPQLP